MRIFAWNAENHKNNIKFTAGVGAGSMTPRGEGEGGLPAVFARGGCADKSEAKRAATKTNKIFTLNYGRLLLIYRNDGNKKERERARERAKKERAMKTKRARQPMWRMRDICSAVALPAVAISIC